MTKQANQWLEKYEIKKPDYDFVDRDYIGMKDAKFEPARYVKKDNVWVAKKLRHRLFKKNRARVMFVGDITCFDKQIEEAQLEQGYDFSYQLEKVKPLFAEADFVVGNLETMIVPNAPYRTEKYVAEQNFHCNAPIEFLDAVRKSGIDMVTNANNHDLDTGAIGIGETIDYIENFGFIHTGTFKTEKKRYELIDVKGIKVAVVAFATEHNNKRCNLTEEGAQFLLNDYNKKSAKNILKQARKEGAEVVFTCIHWGKENVTKHNEKQTMIAEELANIGYDCIIGSHPHVLQPFDKIVTTEKVVPVFYSMGNFLSHNANNVKARSVIACIDMERCGDEVVLECSYIPIYTSKSYGDKKYVVLPVNAKAIDPRNIRKKEQIAEVLGDEIGLTKDIHFMECVEKLSDVSVAKKAAKPNLAKIENFPFRYDDGKFVYKIYSSEVHVEAISEASAAASYSVPTKLLGLPVRELAEGAFQNHPIVKKINFSKNLTVVSERMCKDCLQLEGCQLGSNMTEIKAEAFSGCVKLSSAVMRKNIKKIGTKAFENCTALRSVKITESVVEIAPDAFSGCPNAVFYCGHGSYAEKYAKEHGFKVVNMDLE